MKTVQLIHLTRGLQTMVSNKDYSWLVKFNWYALKANFRFYAARDEWGPEGKKCILMHRFILNLPCSRIPLVDHKNRNTLDNRRHNLRKASPNQNGGNAKKRCDGQINFRGVSWSPLHSAFRADITFKSKHKFLGCFESSIKAAHAYDRAAIKFFGKFASLNFPKLKTKIHKQERKNHGRSSVR